MKSTFRRKLLKMHELLTAVPNRANVFSPPEIASEIGG